MTNRKAEPTDDRRRPKITHILFGGLGGHGSVVFSLIRASRGIAEHELLFVGTGDLLPEYRDRCNREGILWSFQRTSGGADLGFQWRVFRRAYDSRADTIVVHSTGSVAAALAVKLLRRRAAVVVVEHQSWGLRGKRYALASALSLIGADQILVLNEDYVAQLRARFPRLSRRIAIDVVRNGVDTETFSPGVDAAKLPTKPIRVGMQSRLIPIKDHASLIRAIGILRHDHGHDVQLLLAGDGTSRPELEALAKDLALTDCVTFLGMLDEAELVPFLQNLDVYVHASLGEALSTALLQAMACRLPVVASDVPGITDLVAGKGVAVLVPPQDPEALALAVGALAADGPRQHTLGAAAREFVTSNYGLEQAWASYGPFLMAARGDKRRTRNGSGDS